MWQAGCKPRSSTMVSMEKTSIMFLSTQHPYMFRNFHIMISNPQVRNQNSLFHSPSQLECRYYWVDVCTEFSTGQCESACSVQNCFGKGDDGGMWLWWLPGKSFRHPMPSIQGTSNAMPNGRSSGVLAGATFQYSLATVSGCILQA